MIKWVETRSQREALKLALFGRDSYNVSDDTTMPSGSINLGKFYSYVRRSLTITLDSFTTYFFFQ